MQPSHTHLLTKYHSSADAQLAAQLLHVQLNEKCVFPRSSLSSVSNWPHIFIYFGDFCEHMFAEHTSFESTEIAILIFLQISLLFLQVQMLKVVRIVQFYSIVVN